MSEEIERARELRQAQTDAERKLWNVLRNRGVAGYKFRRQVPVGPYFADFLCIEAKLIIELDGSQHATHEAKAYDAQRTAFLESEGYYVIRFWNDHVLTNMDGAVRVIMDVLGKKSDFRK